MTEAYDWQWYKKKCPHKRSEPPRYCADCIQEARESFKKAYEAPREDDDEDVQ